MSKKGFTLAEVLITLGIIGVVAAMTIPTLVSKYQEMALFNQFKKMYANLSNAWKLGYADMGYSPKCYYWTKSPYDGSASCEGNYDESGECTGYYKNDEDKSSLPSDWNGRFNDCPAYGEAILKNLKVIKQCNGNAYRDGCIPDYPGVDTIKEETYTGDEDNKDYEITKATTGIRGFRKNAILNESQAYVLADGSIVISYGTAFRPHIFAIDVNGMQGPNKWGYDLFDMRTKLANDNVSAIIGGGGYAQDGGNTSNSLINKILKSKKN